VGPDGERNLFKATDLYRTSRRDWWLEDEAERIDRARPLGAFLFFPGEEPTAREAMPLFGCHSLTSSSFRLYAKGLREVFAELPDLARGVLTEQHQYVSCHCFRIVGRGGGTVFVPRGFWADQALTMLRLVPDCLLRGARDRVRLRARIGTLSHSPAASVEFASGSLDGVRQSRRAAFAAPPANE